MQDKYVGDVGDFAKYSLLRALWGTTVKDGEDQLSLGVVWYLVPDETGTADGGKTDYLQDPGKEELRQRDEHVAERLWAIVNEDRRSVASVRRDEVLPRRSVYYEERLSYEGVSRQDRPACREEWLEGASRAVVGCDVVFLDPDNGLQVRVKPHGKKGPKYVFREELDLYLDRGQSVVIYQHPSRQGKVSCQAQRRLRELSERAAGRDYKPPFCVRFRGEVSRLFFVVPARQHAEMLRQRTACLLSRWTSDDGLVEIGECCRAY